MAIDIETVLDRWYGLETAENLVSEDWGEQPFALEPNGPAILGPVQGTGSTLRLYLEPEHRNGAVRVRVTR